jgi:hypothetical protein
MVELFAEHQRLYAQAAKKLGIPHRAKGGLSTYLECYPSMKEDTLKGILNRARRDILEALADGRMAPSDAETAFKVVECWRQAQSRLEREKKAEVLFSDMAMF